MTIVHSEIYDALTSTGAPVEKARKAAVQAQDVRIRGER